MSMVYAKRLILLIDWFFDQRIL